MSETQTIPPMPEHKGKGSKNPPSDLVFVENTRTSLYTLRWHDAEHPAPGLGASKFLAPGVNLVTRKIVDACTVKGQTFGDGTRGVLSEIKPLEIRAHEAIALAGRTGSRQALHAWRKLEKRDEVIAAIDARLAPKAKAEDEDDED